MKPVYASMVWLCALVLVHSASVRTARGQSERPHEQVGYAYDLQRFTPAEYAGHSQNLATVQDRRGLVYVANRSGLLEYDSATWRHLRMPNGEGAFSLVLSDSGVVYVGGKGELGYLAPDSIGAMRVVSLMDRVPAEVRNFLYVWSAHKTTRGIYFHTSNRILRWDGRAFTTWDSERRLHTAFAVHDRYFIRTDSTGIQEIIGDELRTVAGTEVFATKRVVAMVPEAAGGVLIAAQQGIDGLLELYRLAEGELARIEVDPHFQNAEATFYNGALLPGGFVALTTTNAGVYIIRGDGSIVQVLDHDYGVPLDGNAMSLDANGGLWIAHNSNGISRLSAPVAMTAFGQAHGLKTMHDMVRFGDRFYVATGAGIFRLKQRELDRKAIFNPNAFEPMNPDALTAWSLAMYRGDLFAGTEWGVMRLANDQFSLLPLEEPIKNVRRVVTSERYPDRLYVGTNQGIGRIERQGANWLFTPVAAAITDPVHSLVEEADGTLWAATRGNQGWGLWRIGFEGGEDLEGDARRIDPNHIPWEGEVVLAAVEGVMRFLPRSGLYVHEPGPDGADRFVLDDQLSDPTMANDSLVTLTEIGDMVWLVYRDRLVYAQKTAGGSYARRTFEHITMPRWESTVSIYRDEHHTLWISCGQNLYRYVDLLDTGVDRTVYFNPMIRGVTVAATDSLLSGWNDGGAAGFPNLTVDSRTNDLTFDYVLPEYSAPDNVLYKVKLENFDSRWSDWTPQTRATYRNLPAGDYRFLVQAQTRSHLHTRESAIALRILPPWSWNIWAWLVYSVILATPVVQFVRHRRARQQLKELERERIVNQRLNEANTQLRAANETLKQANALKDEFLANASHELRTPLTAILGFTDVLKEEIPDGPLEFLELIDENGKRLLRTINSLLDLTKLRAGMLEVHREPLDVCEKSEEIVDMMSQLAKNKGLRMYVDRPDTPIYALLDTHCFERILYNLVGNAIKFTEAGEVEIALEQGADGEAILQVRDTGVGISESFMPHLFSEFKQEPRDDGQPEGSGLGLAITAQLVELMNGEIQVQSVRGVGSTFRIVFPAAGEASPPHPSS